MVSIVEVTTHRQLRQFVDFPNQLYKDVPQFVPATYSDDMEYPPNLNQSHPRLFLLRCPLLAGHARL